MIGAIIIGIAALYIGALRLQVQVATAKEQSASERTAQYALENQQLRNENQQLTNHIAATDAALSKISQLATSTQHQFDVLNGTIEQQNAALETQLAGITKQQPPQTCNDTITYLIDAVKDFPQ
jgi:type II secretory pathway pseudopilin PulG